MSNDWKEPDPVPNTTSNTNLGTAQLRIGSTIANRYLIEGILGVGGMGAVYRARDLHFPNVVKHVAVKEMIIQTHDPAIRHSIIHNFEREADILATLDHPAIPRIFDYFTAQDRSYLVMELINGKTLEELIEADISNDQIIAWAIEICDVLQYLHTHQPEPIIFRDMKPSNIMINQYNRVKLIDFGIAKPFRGEQKGTMIGTEGYSPPEQYRGEATPQADIYALGATLHHVLSRKDPRLEPPFSFGERPLRQYNPDVTPQLETVIIKALQYNPEDRFQSALDMKNALESLQVQQPNQAELENDIAKAFSNEVKLLWEFNTEDEIRGNLTVFEQSLFFGSYDHNLYCIDKNSGELIWLYTTDAAIVSRPLIAEGNVIFGSADNRVYVLNQRNGKINFSYYTQGPIWSSPAYAAGHIFIGSDDCNVHAINLNTGNTSWKLDAGAPVRSSPLIFEDSIFFGTEYGDYYCIDFRGSNRWRFKAKKGVTGSSIAEKNSVYFGSLDANVYALDLKTGWLLWRARLGKATISTPCINGEYLYIGSIDGFLYCLDKRNGKIVWQFETENQVTGSPLCNGERVYFGSVDGFIYCLDAITGNFLWKFQTGAAITSTPTISGNILYIGSTDKKVYALQINPA
ncbi:MAG: PQQ-binding-like beta-propeller repeat protein [Anaerolineales bacterium]